MELWIRLWNDYSALNWAQREQEYLRIYRCVGSYVSNLTDNLSSLSLACPQFPWFHVTNDFHCLAYTLLNYSPILYLWDMYAWPRTDVQLWNAMLLAFRASSSAFSFQTIDWCPGTYAKHRSLSSASSLISSRWEVRIAKISAVTHLSNENDNSNVLLNLRPVCKGNYLLNILCILWHLSSSGIVILKIPPKKYFATHLWDGVNSPGVDEDTRTSIAECLLKVHSCSWLLYSLTL